MISTVTVVLAVLISAADRSLYHCPVPPAFIRGLRLLISVHSTPPASIRDLRLLEALRLLEVLRYSCLSFKREKIGGHSPTVDI